MTDSPINTFSLRFFDPSRGSLPALTRRVKLKLDKGVYREIIRKNAQEIERIEKEYDPLKPESCEDGFGFSMHGAEPSRADEVFGLFIDMFHGCICLDDAYSHKINLEYSKIVIDKH